MHRRDRFAYFKGRTHLVHAPWTKTFVSQQLQNDVVAFLGNTVITVGGCQLALLVQAVSTACFELGGSTLSSPFTTRRSALCLWEFVWAKFHL